MAGPGNEMPERAADGGHFRASHADRERAIEVLKIAFVQERLTKDEFCLRVDQALAARTYVELGAVTGDLRMSPAADRAAPSGPASTPARTLAKAAGRAGACMLAAFVIVGVAALTNAGDGVVGLALIVMVVAVIAASGFLGYGAIDAWHEHRSRRQLPPQPGRNGTGLNGTGLNGTGLNGTGLNGEELGGKGLGGGRPGGDGRDPGRPGDHRDQTLFDRYTRLPRRGRRHISGTGTRTQRRTRPVLDFP
jgi:hypothetical protein